MRVLMTGGGTAGHVNPAIAIANTIKEREPDAEIAFVCSHNPTDKARDLVPRAGYEKLYTVKICGMKKIYNPANIKTLYYMMTSPSEAKWIINEFKPDIIIGTGGFACYPVARAGVKLGIPVLLHESNAIVGKAIQKLAPHVDLVMTNFEETAKRIPHAKKVMKVGNPTVKSGAGKNTAGAESDGFERHVLCFGGSLGAENVNLAFLELLKTFSDKYPSTKFLHASGKRDHSNILEKYRASGLDKKGNVELVDYIYDMDKQMARADLVICRAGAMTISELALGGKCAILVPSPYVAENHQYKNAKTLADVGAAVLVEEHELSGGRLKDEAERLLGAPEICAEMQKRIVSFAEPDANGLIYAEVKKYAK